MKKILGILCAGVFVLTIFMNANATNGASSDLDLVNLLTLNSANAECASGTLGWCGKNTSGSYVCWASSDVYGNNCK